MAAGDPAGDREQPGRHRGAALPLGQPAVHHDEHVLHRVLDPGLGDAERPQHPPDERDVGRVDVVERRHDAVELDPIEHLDGGGHAVGWCTGGGQSSRIRPSDLEPERGSR